MALWRLIAFGILAVACTPRSSARMVLTGRVVDSATGNGLRHARVFAGRDTATVDSTGRFTIQLSRSSADSVEILFVDSELQPLLRKVSWRAASPYDLGTIQLGQRLKVIDVVVP